MVFQVTVFETVEEFLDARDDIPDTVYVVYEGGDTFRLSGEGHGAFSVELLSWDVLAEEALRRAGLRVHFT